jgi:hypothetical protein
MRPAKAGQARERIAAEQTAAIMLVVRVFFIGLTSRTLSEYWERMLPREAPAWVSDSAWQSTSSTHDEHNPRYPI